VGKTHEVTRAVIKILYEGKKPEIEATAIRDEAEGKTDRIAFEKAMSQEYAKILIPVLNKWISDGFPFNWGVIGFAPRVIWKGKPKSVVDIYPDHIALFSIKMAKKKGFPIEPFNDYKISIDKVPRAKQTLLEGRRYLKYSDISLKEFRAIIDATDKLIRKLRNFKT
jgi:hypothetical protein